MTFLVLTGTVPDVHIHGIVRDSADRSPLAGATVRVDGTKLGAIADRSGIFHLHDVPTDTVVLRISMVGYATRQVRVATMQDVRLEVLLPPSSARSDAIVVEQARGPHGALPTQAATLITAAELDEHRGQTFADALTMVPGVTVMNTGPSISKPVVHGMSGTRLVLRNNGIAQEGQQWGAEHAPEIDPFSPASITLVKGPAAVMYGPNAMGGAIDVEPRPVPDERRTTGELTMNGFANNRQGSASLMLEQGHAYDSPLSMRAQLSARRAGDSHTPDYNLRNTAFSELSGSLMAAWGTSASNVVATYSRYSTSLGIFKGAHLGNPDDLFRAIERGTPSAQGAAPFSYAIGNPHQEIVHTMFTVQGKWTVDTVGVLRATYGWQQNDRSEFDAHNSRILGRGDDPVERARDSIARLERSLVTPAMNLLLTTYSLDVAYDHKLAGNVHGSVGASGMRQVNDRSGSVYLVPDFRTLGWGIYAYESLVLEDMTMTVGARYDLRDNDIDVRYRNQNASTPQTRTFSGFSGGLGVLLHTSAVTQVYANAGAAWRPPQMNELFGNDVHHGVAYYEVGDSSLVPERNIGVDAGVRWTQPGVHVEVGAYLNSMNTYILSLPDPSAPTITIRGTFPTYRFTQHRALMAGVDVSADIALTDAVSLYAKGSMVRGADRTLQQPLFLMPADRLRTGVHVHAPDVWFVHDAYAEASVTAVRTQDQFVAGQDYAPPPPGYVLGNLDVGGSIDLFGSTTRVSVTVGNILDTPYRDYLSRFRYFADDAGRDIIVRWRIPF